MGLPIFDGLMSNTYTKPRLTTEQVEKFNLEGYLLPKEPVFSQSEFDALRAHFEEKIANSPADIFKKITSSPIFDNPVINKLFNNNNENKENKEEKKSDL